ncbi:MAG: hypothetical protein ACJ71Q_06075 [Terriglobales bacterium]
MDIRLRAACHEDLAFARQVYFETMRWILERLVGCEEKNFAEFFKVDEVRIVTSDAYDVGWVRNKLTIQR